MLLIGCLFALLFGLAWTALCSLLAMLAWNLVVPSLFHGPTVNFWQAWAVIFLLSLVTGMLRPRVESK